MKRNITLIRKILEIVEEAENAPESGLDSFTPIVVGADGIGAHELLYHIILLVDAGYVKAQQRGDEGRPEILRLTWAGHDYLDSVRGAEARAASTSNHVGGGEGFASG